MSKLNLLKEYCKEENLDFDEVIKKLKNITTKYEEKKKQHDPLTDPKNKRNSILPIIYSEIWKMYKDHKGAKWVETEINYTEDLPDWNKMDKDSQYFIKMMLAYFSPSDLIVNENESENESEITIPEVQFYIRNKMEREDIHSLTYGLHLETLVPDKEERIKLINSVETIPVIKAKAEWFRNYINNGTLTERIVAGAITEGIFFSSSFCSIFWLKKQGLMPALTFSNELISKDEGNHRDFYCLIYRSLISNKLPKERVIEMIKTAVILEQNFATDSLPVKLVGMNADLMKQYIEYVANHLALNLIEQQIYNVENPFEGWMEMISLSGKINFFDKKVGDYAETSVLSKREDNEIRFDADF
jgi:ribonucleoside-diphosphate reductase beta chain